MDLRTFFNTYYEDDILYRALIWYDRDFNTLDDFIEFKLTQLKEGKEIKQLVHTFSLPEIKWIERLVQDVPEDNIYVIKDNDLLTSLKEFQYGIETSNGTLVHEDIIKYIHDALLSEGLMSQVKTMLEDKDISAPRDIYKLKPIYTGSKIWLYDNLTTRELRRIISKLNITDYGSYKDSYIENVIHYLTTKEHLTHALSLLPNEILSLIKHNVDNEIYIYENKTMWYEAKALGILVPVHRDYLVMHEDILKTIQTINFSNITAIEKSKYYNGYELSLTVKNIPTIQRKVVIPTRLNFYELIQIIKSSFIWENNKNTIQIGDFTITEYNEGLQSDLIQVDALLTKYKSFTFNYNSSENYIVEGVLNKTVTTDYFSPTVVSYSGETPIDNVGTVDDVLSMLEVLHHKEHPDYSSIYTKARKRNYRERYPLTAINTHLSKLIHQERPLFTNVKD